METFLVILLLCVSITFFLTSCTFTRRLLSFPTPYKTHYMRDIPGRTIIYHGANISNYSKHSGPPLPSTGIGVAGLTWHGEKEASDLESWGFNIVRYTVFWEAIEPIRGQYDNAYIDSVIEKIRLLGNHGVDVIVDIHQDLFAQRYHGDGFPEWAVRDDGKKFEFQESWAMNYFQPAVRACFDNFWSNKDGLLDANVAMIEHVLLKVKEIPNVIGIDVINEPWPKGFFLKFERKELTHYYEKLMEMWLKHNNGYPHLMFEPWMSTSAGYPTNLRVNNWKGTHFCGLVYMPHYYDFFCEQRKPYRWFNRQVMKRGMNIRSSEAEEFESPMLYGEFGFPLAVKNCKKAYQNFLDLADKHTVGWCHWAYDKNIHSEYGLITEGGKPTEYLGLLVRIYPQRIGGTNAKYSFKKDVFKMTWDYKDSDWISPINNPTEVYVPESWEVEIESDCPFARTDTKVLFDHRSNGKRKHNVKITVKNRNGFPL